MTGREREEGSLPAERRLWELRLREDCPQMSAAEQEQCIAWLERLMLDSILCQWFRQRRVSMRWNALEDRPDFEAR